MFSLFHSASSQISINVLTTTVTTVTTIAEAGRLPLSLTLSSDSEDTMRTASSAPDVETEDEKVETVVAPGLKQEDDLEATYPYFPTHPFRNLRHARSISTANAPPPIQLFALHSDPCPFPSPPSPTLGRRTSSPNLHGNPDLYAAKSSTRSKFAKLLHFIPSGSKKYPQKENKMGAAVGYHYQLVQDRLQREKKKAGNSEKSPSAFWRSEGYW